MSRDGLGAQQVAFLAALNSKAGEFPGVPCERLASLRDALAARRCKQARLRAPLLAGWLGPRFEPGFRAWMGEDPQLAGPRAEILGFAAGFTEVPDAVAEELRLLKLAEGRPGWRARVRGFLSRRRRAL